MGANPEGVFKKPIPFLMVVSVFVGLLMENLGGDDIEASAPSMARDR